jgi:hypothetical protein
MDTNEKRKCPWTLTLVSKASAPGSDVFFRGAPSSDAEWTQRTQMDTKLVSMDTKFSSKVSITKGPWILGFVAFWTLRHLFYLLLKGK